MIQVQYMVDSLDESEDIANDLEFIGIPSSHVHYLSQDAGAIAAHHLTPANMLEERDILRLGAKGSFYGLFIGVVISTVINFFQPFGWQPVWYNFVLITLLCVGFSSWLGGLMGIAYENYKISDFHQYLVKGKALIMIYLRPTDVHKVLDMMSTKHPDVRYLATKEALDNPFDSTKSVEHD